MGGEGKAPRRAAPIALVLEAEMPSVEAAARCPIRELWAQVTALRRELDGLDAEVGARAHEREAAADGACPIAARTRAGAGSGSVKDVPTVSAVGGLEAMLKARAVADSLGAHIRGADDAAAERARPAPHIAADDDDTDFGVQNATLMEVAH